jgi:hypothetical protein
LLSLLSALVVASTAFVGVSIYAQTDDSELTTFEEEAIAAGEQFEDMTGNATSDDNATGDGSTSIADVSVLEGLVVCDLGTAEISEETEVASFDETTTPTVSVTVMSETEVAELTANETETASAAEPANCVMTDGGDDSSGDAEDATPDAGNATSTTADGNATSTSDATSTSTLGSDGEILVVEGQDFASGQVVLMFTENALVGIDDVDENGEIEAKIPMPEGGETAVAGVTELRLLESGTQRTATFEFDGETLTAEEGGDIEAEGSEDDNETTLTPAPSNSTNSTSSSNSTNSTTQ